MKLDSYQVCHQQVIFHQQMLPKVGDDDGEPTNLLENVLLVMKLKLDIVFSNYSLRCI